MFVFFRHINVLLIVLGTDITEDERNCRLLRKKHFFLRNVLFVVVEKSL